MTANKWSTSIVVINAALGLKDKYDEVWAVFDEDNFKEFDKQLYLLIKAV